MSSMVNITLFLTFMWYFRGKKGRQIQTLWTMDRHKHVITIINRKTKFIRP